MANNDAWLKVLEQRVAELKRKEELHKEEIGNVIARFRDWVNEAEDIDIYYNAEYEVSKVTNQRETYKSAWAAFKKAEAELENYKETMGF